MATFGQAPTASLRGKVALITGGASGLGRTLAARLGQLGPTIKLSLRQSLIHGIINIEFINRQWLHFTPCGFFKRLYSFLAGKWGLGLRSEEHTSELQSLMRISYAVVCLLK